MTRALTMLAEKGIGEPAGRSEGPTPREPAPGCAPGAACTTGSPATLSEMERSVLVR